MRIFKYFILLFSLMLSCAVLKAQDRLGYLNVQELLVIMPEYKTAEDSLQAFTKKIQSEYLELQNDYNYLYAKYESIIDEPVRLREDVLREVADIKSLENRLSQMEENSDQLLLERQAQLLFPLEQRIIAAIKAVAKENGYIYIIDSSVMDVTPIVPDADDIFPLVMQKLGGSWVSEAP